MSNKYRSDIAQTQWIEKRLYDIEYRQRNAEMLKQKKARYHQRTYDPEKAREILRTTNTQLRIAQQAKRPVSVDVIRFSEE